jgi:hypothetical protein
MKYPTSPINLQTRDAPSPFFRRACRLLLRSFATILHLNALFSIACSLFSKNTRVGGVPQHRTTHCSLPTTHFFQAFIFNILRIPTNPSSTQKTIYSHTLTNPFSRNPFVFSSIQIPRVAGNSRFRAPLCVNSADSASLRYQFGQSSQEASATIAGTR